jgi:hypothetical protein
MAWLQGAEDFGMREPDAALIPIRGIGIKIEFLTLDERD